MTVIDLRWQRQLRRRFDRAAPRYAVGATLQHQAAEHLLASAVPAGCVLDVGCGSGHLARRLRARPGVTQVLALDISHGMLRAAAAPGLDCLQADAAQLPIRSGVIDQVFSNFALHWCPAATDVLRELRRVVQPGGCAHLMIPVQGSLHQAAETDTLHPASYWQRAAADAGWSLRQGTAAAWVEHHATPAAWLQALRDLGVTARRQAVTGLAGRAHRAALLQALEDRRTPAGIPLGYACWQACLVNPGA